MPCTLLCTAGSSGSMETGFLEGRAMKPRNGVAVPAATSCPRLHTVPVGEMWNPQQELLHPTPHFSPSKNSHSGLLAGCWFRRSPRAPASLDLTPNKNQNIVKAPHRRVLREIWDSFPNSTPTCCLFPDWPSRGIAAVPLSGAHLRAKCKFIFISQSDAKHQRAQQSLN